MPDSHENSADREATATESVTGFEPAPSRAPDRLADALASFAKPALLTEGREVDDPRDAMSDEEQKRHLEDLKEILWAQRYAETLTGGARR